jgi:beta-glucanase (GH16 family)
LFVLRQLTAPPIGNQTRDEIDIEILGGDRKHWQTNVFAPSPQDSKPHYGVLNSIEKVDSSSSNETPTINDYHAYSIDWNEERIIWSIDGKATRTLSKGVFHIDISPVSKF